MSLVSVIQFLDKIVDKEVSNLKTLNLWLTEAQAVIAAQPPSLIGSQVEVGIGALLPLINLVQADLTPIATTLDKAVAAIPMTGAQAASVVITVANSIAAAAPAVGAAATTAEEAIKSGGH
jgi:hypothetical protein